MQYVIPIILILVLIGIFSSIRVVNTGSVAVVERLGQFHRILEPGWHFIIPFFDFVRRKV